MAEPAALPPADEPAPEPAAVPTPGTAATQLTIPAGMHLQVVHTAGGTTPSRQQPPDWWHRTWPAFLRTMILPVLAIAAWTAVIIDDGYASNSFLTMGTWGGLSAVFAGLAVWNLARVRAVGLAWALALAMLLVGFGIGTFWDDFGNNAAYAYPAPTTESPLAATTSGAGWYCAAGCFGGPVPQRIAARFGAPKHGNAATTAWTCSARRCFGGPIPADVARRLGAHPTTAGTSPTALNGALVIGQTGSWQLAGRDGSIGFGQELPGRPGSAAAARPDVALLDLRSAIAGAAGPVGAYAGTAPVLPAPGVTTTDPAATATAPCASTNGAC